MGYLIFGFLYKNKKKIEVSKQSENNDNNDTINNVIATLK